MSVAIVTGGSKGLGRALAQALAFDGWQLVLDARCERDINEVRDELSTMRATALVLPGDVSDPDHRAKLIEAAVQLGSLDLLVNNASTLGPSPLMKLADYPLGELRRVFEVNTFSPLALIQSALPLLRRSGGVTVTMSSDAAHEAYPRWGGYGSSKAASDQLMAVLAQEESGVKFYSFDPGDMRTDMHQAAFPGEDISDRPSPESVVAPLRQLLKSRRPSGHYRASEISLS
jgi:NAD(P)-dependent dehydrogenase (short-subunit alcohol dehydrogenase family)